MLICKAFWRFFIGFLIGRPISPNFLHAAPRPITNCAPIDNKLGISRILWYIEKRCRYLETPATFLFCNALVFVVHKSIRQKLDTTLRTWVNRVKKLANF